MRVVLPRPELYGDWKSWATTVIATLEEELAQIDDWLPGDLRTTVAQVYDENAWVLADGTTLLIAEYPSLYRAIGDTFNSGSEAEGEFSVPDLTPFTTDHIVLVKT